MILRLNFSNDNVGKEFVWGEINEPIGNLDAVKSSPQKAHGEYAIIYYENKHWHIIRDKLGVQPVYYTKLSGSELWVSDSYGELLNALSQATLNSEHKDRVRSYNFENLTETPCREIFRAKAATITSIGPKSFSSKPYWSVFDFNIDKFSQEKWLRKINECFSHIIKEKTKKPKQLGILWSGGIDSTSIVLKASEFTNQATALSLTFEDPKIAGAQMHKKVKAYSQLKHIDFDFKSKPISFYFPSAEEINNGVLYDANNIMCCRPLYETAQKMGLKTIANGYGPDFLFDPPFSIWSQTSLLKNLTSFREACRDYLNKYGLKITSAEVFKVFLFNLPKSFQKILLKKQRPHLADVQADIRLRYLRSSLFLNGGLAHGLEQAQELAHIYDIKLTYPYLDTRFIELALNTPICLYWKKGASKPAFRLFASQFVPSHIATFETQQNYHLPALEVLKAGFQSFWPDQLPKLPLIPENIERILGSFNHWKTEQYFGERHEKEKNL